MRSKYHAKKVVIDGLTFDSKKEAQRYGELLLLQRAGHLHSLKVHPPFELQAKFHHPIAGNQRAMTYTADFSYVEAPPRGWGSVVEDVKTKATKTEAYKLRRKLFLKRYPEIDPREVE